MPSGDVERTWVEAAGMEIIIFYLSLSERGLFCVIVRCAGSERSWEKPKEQLRLSKEERGHRR
jgi:hypothetical protein